MPVNHADSHAGANETDSLLLRLTMITTATSACLQPVFTHSLLLLHPFNGLFQDNLGNPSLDVNEARDDGIL